MDNNTQIPLKSQQDLRVKPQFLKQKPIKCTACTKTYSDKYSMKAHFKKVHEKQKGFLCNQCGLYLSSEKMLKRHITVVHETQVRKSPILISRNVSNESNSSQNTTADTFLMCVSTDSNCPVQSVGATPTKKTGNTQQFDTFQEIEENENENSADSFESFSFIPKISQKTNKMKIQEQKNVPYQEVLNSTQIEYYPRNINLDFYQIEKPSSNIQIITSNAGYLTGSDTFVKFEQQPKVIYSNPNNKVAQVKQLKL